MVAVKISSCDDDDGVMMDAIFWGCGAKTMFNVAKTVFEFSEFVFYLSKSWSIASCGFTV